MAGKREEWEVGKPFSNRVIAPSDTGPDIDIAECPGTHTGPAKAARIVREHNMHQRLVALCKTVRDREEHRQRCWLLGSVPCKSRQLLEELREVIAEAGKEGE